MNSIFYKVLRIFHLISKKKYNEKRQIEIVKKSPLFDRKWYLKQNPDVAARKKKISAAEHYVKYGWKEGRNPSKEFDGNKYLAQHPDIVEKNWCPIFHYMKENKAQTKIANTDKRPDDLKIIKKSKYFNKRWYLKQYPDVKKAGINPAKHYLDNGWKEGRNPSKKFDTKTYLARYNDVKNAKINPLLHYEKFGKKEGRTIYNSPNALLVKIVKKIKEILPQKQRTKILLISHEMTYTGAPLSLLQAAKCFKDKGFKVSVMSLRKGDLAREFKKLGIKVRIVSTQHNFNLFVQAVKNDIAIVNTLVPYMQYEVLSQIMPTIWWVRENPILLNRNDKMREIFSKGKNIYTMSDYSRAEFLPYNNDIKVIKHGMEDLYNSVSAPTKKIRFAVIGTISPRKGQDILIESIMKLKKKYLDISEFYIIGKSLDAATYNKISEAQKTFSNIIVMDEIKQTTDMLKYYENLTCVIIPSRNEPTSRVAIEAMMMGRPVIMSNHVGAQYLLAEGQNGYMFESENSDELAEKISLFIDNITNIGAMSETARQAYLANNSMKALSDNLEKMIKNFSNVKPDIYYIKKSKYFNKNWYLKQYHDVKKAGINPAKHYLNNGWKEGRNPSALFNTKDYLEKYSDVQRANICPLLHFEKNGKKEGRDPQPKTYSYYYSLPTWKYVDELKLWFKQQTGQELNLEKPQTYNEKIQWLKLYDSTPLKTRLADKYLVRDWVKEKIGAEYLIPLLGVYDKFEDIDFDKLPDKFVIKCNHGSGWNIIVKDKSKLDLNDVKNKLDTWMQRNFAFQFGFELQYRDMQPQIVIEKFIENKQSGDLFDYKFWCFNGKVEYIQFLSERSSGELKMAFYNTKWQKQNFVYNHHLDIKDIEKPNNLNEMIVVAETLSKGFSHTRIDLYRMDDGKIYFGEVTFSSMSGACRWNQKNINVELGKLVRLPKLAYNIDTKEYMSPQKCYIPKSIDIKTIMNKKAIPDIRKLKLSIIVPIYNAVKDVEICLNSLLSAKLNKSTEVILMDDCSNAETHKFLQKFVKNHSSFKLFHNKENLGFIKNCNKGIELAKNDVVVLLNSDTKVPVGFDKTVLECFASDINIGIASPLSTHSGLFRIPENDKYNLNQINKIIQANSKNEYPLITPEGFCFAIRKEIIDKIGALDEVFGIGYCEEDDMVMRALEQGYKTVLIDNLIVYHKSHASFTSETREQILKRNILIFRRKWNDLQAKIRNEIKMFNNIKKINDFYNNLIENK